MNVLVLDIGFRNMGWVIFDLSKAPHRPIACGVICTEKSDKKLKVRAADDNMRCSAELATGLVQVIKRYGVYGILGELPHGGSQNATAAKQMQAASSVVAAVAEIAGLPADFSTPEEGKLALCGKKTASKKEMIAAAKKRWENNIEFPKAEKRAEHIADACACFLVLQNSNVVKTLSQLQKAVPLK